MSQFVETATRTFTAGGTIAKHARVYLSSGTILSAGVADKWIGTAERSAVSGDVIAVRLRTAQGTVKMIAAGAVTAGAVVYAAASGKIDDAITTDRIGLALGAASDADEIIEVLMCGSGFPTRFASGEVTLDGSNPTPITTGLNTITSGGVTLKSATAPGDDPSWASVDYSGSDGTLNLYAWKNTGGTDPTLVASTNSAAVFTWWAVGT